MDLVYVGAVYRCIAVRARIPREGSEPDSYDATWLGGAELHK